MGEKGAHSQSISKDKGNWDSVIWWENTLLKRASGLKKKKKKTRSAQGYVVIGGKGKTRNLPKLQVFSHPVYLERAIAGHWKRDAEKKRKTI